MTEDAMSRGTTWAYDPTRGGTKITSRVKVETEQRIRAYAEKYFKGKYTRLDVRFRGCLCHVDAYQEPEPPKTMPRDWHESKEEYVERLRNVPTHLCRLRYFREDVWGLALFVYSSEKYETSVYHSGKFEGTPEEAMDLAGDFHLH
jgi:hypothetical protein